MSSGVQNNPEQQSATRAMDSLQPPEQVVAIQRLELLEKAFTYVLNAVINEQSYPGEVASGTITDKAINKSRAEELEQTTPLYAVPATESRQTETSEQSETTFRIEEARMNVAGQYRKKEAA